MKIVILGPGAMGCLLGAFLAKSGEEVILLDHRAARAARLAKNGLWVKSSEGDFRVSVNASTEPAEIGLVELLLVCVKAFDTAAAAEWAAPCVGENTAVLTLQNGLGNVETLEARFGKERVIGGTTGHGATLLGIGEVIHAGAGETVIGKPSGARSQRVEKIKAILDNAGLSTAITSDLAGAIWGKVVLNCAINPLAALTRLRNGDLLREPSLANLLGEVAMEAAQVAAAKGIRLPYSDPAAKVKQACEQTAGNINSMLADVLNKKRTEINEINGAVLRAAEEVGLKAPLNAALLALVCGVEGNYPRLVN